VNYWKVILATVVIFGAGVLTGGMLVNFVDHSHPKNFHRPPPPGTNSVVQTGGPGQPKPQRLPEILSRQMVEQLNDELRLTPEQRQAVESIIAESQGQMRKVVQAVRQGAREKIRDLLDPGQQKQFDELMKRAQKRSPNSTNTSPAVSEPTNLPPPLTSAPGV
jgi:hypothetical protein